MSLNCLLSDTVDEEQTTSAEIESYTRKIAIMNMWLRKHKMHACLVRIPDKRKYFCLPVDESQLDELKFCVLLVHQQSQTYCSA